jgi:hypothetical protein
MSGEKDANGWDKWKNLVLDTQKRTETKIDRLSTDVVDLKVQVGRLKLVASIWGSGAGILGAAIVVALKMLLG